MTSSIMKHKTENNPLSWNNCKNKKIYQSLSTGTCVFSNITYETQSYPKLDLDLKAPLAYTRYGGGKEICFYSNWVVWICWCLPVVRLGGCGAVSMVFNGPLSEETLRRWDFDGTKKSAYEMSCKV